MLLLGETPCGASPVGLRKGWCGPATFTFLSDAKHLLKESPAGVLPSHALCVPSGVLRVAGAEHGWKCLE